MAINIQNLLSAANAKIGVAAVDAADSARLASLTNFVNNHRNTQTFASFASLPTADSSNFGQIVRVAADSAGTYLDSGSTFYVSYVNQWKQVLFSGDSDVTVGQFVPAFQGRNFGYTSGGSPFTNVIDKFPFASNASASDVGDLTIGRYYVAGQSSSTHGYTSGGFSGGALTTIDKFPFSSNANATDVGDLFENRYQVAGQSSSDNGYTSGGLNPDLPTGPTLNTIDKFPFSSDANAIDVGNLFQNRSQVAGQSSTTHGYTSGGLNPTLPTGPHLNTIDKFPFATDASASDVGNLSIARRSAAGQSSETHGYTSGGATSVSPEFRNEIDKFPFASDANASDVGDLTQARYGVAGQSSIDNGYTSGGWPSTWTSTPTVFSNVIDKFPFASDASASDVGDLTEVRNGPAGQQY